MIAYSLPVGRRSPSGPGRPPRFVGVAAPRPWPGRPQEEVGGVRRDRPQCTEPDRGWAWPARTGSVGDQGFCSGGGEGRTGSRATGNADMGRGGLMWTVGPVSSARFVTRSPKTRRACHWTAGTRTVWGWPGSWSMSRSVARRAGRRTALPRNCRGARCVSASEPSSGETYDA